MMKSLKVVAYSSIFFVLTSTIAISCALEFPWQLLDNRSYTLFSLTGQSSDFDSPTGGDFIDRLALLLPITTKEKSNFTQSMELYKKEQKANSLWVDEKFLSKNICQATGEAYQQAAFLFHNQQYDAAYKAFNNLSNFGSSKEKVCARYNLARVMERMSGNNQENAIKTYISTIELVANQGIDPFDLGLAAYGQAARLILEQGDPNSKTGMIPLGKINNKTLKFEVGDIQKNSVSQLHRALYFYVKQALLGGETGKASVVIIMRGLTDSDSLNAKELLAQSMKDPFIRKVVLAYALNHDLFYQDNNPKVIQNIFDHFVKATEDKVDMGDDWGALAAFAYQHNDIQKALFFAEKGMKIHPQAISAWILAKIALRNDNTEKAQKYYHQAIALLNDKTMVPEEQHKIQGEQSVLTLSQGDFVQALEQLWPVSDEYWGDIIYIAENILTLDELKQFADKHTKQLPQKPMDVSSQNIETAFRNLVAHRLLREGKGQEALQYYSDVKDKAIAIDYLANKQKIKQGKLAIQQANAIWENAKIMRNQGMEIESTYGYPDYAPGAIFGGYSQQPDNLTKLENRKWSVPEEQQRLYQSSVTPLKRFHYRYIAADEAVKAANLIPTRSQAYAAILCHANGWMQNTAYYEKGILELWDNNKGLNLAEHRADSIYAMYVKNGAIVPFATHFGYGCPNPDFSRISNTQIKVEFQNISNYLHQLKYNIVKSNEVKE